MASGGVGSTGTQSVLQAGQHHFLHPAQGECLHAGMRLRGGISGEHGLNYATMSLLRSSQFSLSLWLQQCCSEFRAKLRPGLVRFIDLADFYALTGYEREHRIIGGSWNYGSKVMPLPLRETSLVHHP